MREWSVDMTELLIHVLMGIALAACAGLRAFLPMLAVGILAKSGVITLSPSFAWMAEVPALVVFSVATVAEILADKFPGVDHVLDVAATWIKPIAAMVLIASQVTQMPAWAVVSLAIIGGGAAATTVHLQKAAVRAGSTALTAGIGNPVLSLIEDVVCAVGIVLSILVPAAVVLALLISLFWLARKLSRKRVAAT